MKARIAFALIAALAPAMSAAAQDFPNKPVTMIVPSVAGGPVDSLARAVAPVMSAALGKPVLIDNKPGASGKIGIQALLNAPRDGYTMAALTYTYLVTLPATDTQAGYDPEKDLLPLTNGIVAPAAFVVHSSVPATTLKEAIELAKREAGKLNYGTFGIASSVHFGTEALFDVLGIGMTHVPYKGEAQSLQDLVAGRLQYMLVSGAIKPFVENGTVRILATTGESRWSQFPNTPTVREQGYDYAWAPWQGFGAATGIPDEAKRKLHAAIVQALNTDSVKAALGNLGYETAPTSPEVFATLVRTDRKMVEGVLRSGRVKLDQ